MQAESRKFSTMNTSYQVATDASSRLAMNEETHDLSKGSFFQDGIGLIDLADDGDIPCRVFASFRTALPYLRADPSFHILPDATDAHSVTGFHAAGELSWSSRSNSCREGIVLSNGASLELPHDLDLQPLVQLLHLIASQTLRMIEEKMGLPRNWFDDRMGGGTSMQSTSQFHLKNYVMKPNHQEDTPTHSTSNSDEGLETPPTLLPSHTDPSLLSVVILDRPGKQPGSQGLEYCTAGGQWRETSHSGHGVAIVLVGSALSYITGGHLPAPRHRVRTRLQEPRCAATLFLRPVESAMLEVPPSPRLAHVQLKRTMAFAEWNARVSKNYRTTKSKPRSNCRKKREIVNGVVFRDEYTELALWHCPVAGREKFLGGELSSRNGKIYTIPGHASRVMVIDAPQLERVTLDGYSASSNGTPAMYCIGPQFAGEFKWLRGASMPSGLIVGIPCHAGSILCIDPETDHVFTVEWDDSDPLAPPKDLPWKWHGGQVSPADGCLYCIPQRAETVLKFDPKTLKATFLGGPFAGRNKWYGGLMGRDGAIYGVHQNHRSVLRIDPSNQTATVHGDFPEGGHKWHGGVLGPDGSIYGIPANAETVLKIEPGPIPKLSTIGGPLRSGQHRSDGKYKYLGGAVGADGNVYLFPSDADRVLQIHPETGVCRDVGPDLRGMEAMQQNKWQNGFASGDCLYGIPLKGNSVIRVRVRRDGQEDPEVTAIGGPFLGLNKWEGGVMSKAGVMYCMPLNHSHVLQIRPLPSQCTTGPLGEDNCEYGSSLSTGFYDT